MPNTILEQKKELSSQMEDIQWNPNSISKKKVIPRDPQQGNYRTKAKENTFAAAIRQRDYYQTCHN